ncbi:MAG: hypothetical protein KDA36_02125 [Planctomycetaceae bacterium]|nr:hypothetical protein [Planctomycetaceae bacterium]
MSLPMFLSRFLTRINRNGPIAWTLFFAMNATWFYPLFADLPHKPNPGLHLGLMALGGCLGLAIKTLLVWSGKFESTSE